jgi:SAM-dependent methyltransferase
MELEPTGERMIVEHYRASPETYVIYLLHVATYRFAEQFTQGKRVLDYGCGSGYGAAQIAQSAAHVVAVDVAEDAITYARHRFASMNLEFHCINPTVPLPFDDASFEVVLSFQVLEHVLDTESYISEIRRVLAPGGRLVLVTPDRSTRLLWRQRPWNRWHVHEYGRGELRDLVRGHFSHVDVLGMTASSDMIGIELRRCSSVKWMTLPFTLPGLPNRWRIAGLNLIHHLRGERNRARAGELREYPFTVDDVEIAANAAPSVNLVAIAS